MTEEKEKLQYLYPFRNDTVYKGKQLEERIEQISDLDREGFNMAREPSLHPIIYRRDHGRRFDLKDWVKRARALLVKMREYSEELEKNIYRLEKSIEFYYGIDVKIVWLDEFGNEVPGLT